MKDEIKSMDKEELKKRVQYDFIKFFVFLAISTGLILTSIALGSFGKQPLLINLIPAGIAVICIFPLYTTLKRATNEKRELDRR